MPYNPRYATYQGTSALPTIPEDGPPPQENFDPVAFPEGPQKDDSDSASVTKESFTSRTTCGKYPKLARFTGYIRSKLRNICLIMN